MSDDESMKCDLDALEKLAGDTDVENLHVACDEIAGLRNENTRLRAALTEALRILGAADRTLGLLPTDHDRIAELRKLLA